MTTHWSVRLTALGARCEAVIWAKTQPDAATAWRTCRRGDWMLWVAAQAGVDRKRMVMAACAVARTALVHVPAGEHRPLRCIEVAEDWCRGGATIEQVLEARRAAHAAADAAAYYAYAAAYAAAAYAAYVAYADAANAAYDDAAAAARSATLKECADIVRRLIPFQIIMG